MNFLAHAYLSFRNPGILAGNMISDFVKGRKKNDYPATIREGIGLHRAIDEFTDGHEQTKMAKEFFRPAYRLYSGAFVDIVYDHFLANDPRIFNPDSLRKFASDTYAQLESQLHLLPENFQRIFPYMQSQNWLYHYRYEKGIESSFGGLVRRAKYLQESDEAFRIFKAHYPELETCYQHFFPELENYSKKIFESLQK